MRRKEEVNLSPVKTPAGAEGYTMEQALEEAARCLDCPAKYCRRDCPIHVPVPEMCERIRARDFAGAYALISAANDLSAIGSRVCPGEKQCQSHCTRGIRGEAVNIGALEQFVNDWHDKYECDESCAAASGGAVAVVGSGPAGIACAMELARKGFCVTVYEASDKPGGVPSWGIPGFILPDDPLTGLLERAGRLGVTFICGKALGRDFSLGDLKKSGFQAVFLAVGAPSPAGSMEGAVQAADFLREASEGQDPVQGRSVAVIGGGDTALDAARVAVRMGAPEVKLLYRRGKEQMPGRREDAKAAEEEGVRFVWWTDAREITENGLICVRTEPAPPDYPGGRLNEQTVPGSEHPENAELVILALGFGNIPVEGVSCDDRGRIRTDEDGRTDVPGVFAGGDAVTGPGTVIRAAAAGKRAAAGIMNYLENNKF